MDPLPSENVGKTSQGDGVVRPSIASSIVLSLIVTCTLANWFPSSSYGETSPTALRNATRKLLIHESKVETLTAQQDAATALCDLYVVLRSDPRYTTSRMLQSDAMKIRRRLLTIATDQQNRLERAGIEPPPNLQATVQAALQHAASGDPAKTEHTSSSRNDSKKRHEISPRDRGAAGGGAIDDGWQLVELIQRIVAPDFWDRRGGAGSIHYFALRRVLVVRATSDVHQQVKDLLTALR